MKRHPTVALHIPEATSAQRAKGFNKIIIKKFDLLEVLMDRYSFTPDRIYNFDEAGITAVQSRPQKSWHSGAGSRLGLSPQQRGAFL